MSYEVKDDKLSLLVNNIEAGYIKYNKTDGGIEITQTYVFPGFRENGYARQLVAYMNDNYDGQISSVKCAYYRIMASAHKLSKAH